jgi:hypothetical protein
MGNARHAPVRERWATMRDIDAVLARLASVWKRCPELRLGQLLSNSVEWKGGLERMYHVDDDKLVEDLDAFVKDWVE